MKKNKCAYPGCENETNYKVRKNLSLCEEHYKLWRFIDELLFTAHVEINTRRSRFDE